jgi:hypothetical protein
MKNHKKYILLCSLICFCLQITGCKTKKTVIPQVDVLSTITKNTWLIDRYTDTNKQTVSDGKLNVSAKLMYGLEFEFKTNFQVRALDKVSRSVFNAGTWSVTSDNKVIKIDIPGIKDDFQLVELSVNKMILQPNEKVFPVVDNKTKVYMEFIPKL